MHILKKIFLCVLAAMAGFPLFAQQEQEQDSLVVLISAKSAQMVDIEGASYRKVIGPARLKDLAADGKSVLLSLRMVATR